MSRRRSKAHLTSVLGDCSADLLKYFLRRLDREDAADALAEVMTVAWARIDAMPDQAEEARMWLFGIARNTLMHARRGAIRRARLADRLRNACSFRSAPAADAGLEVRDAIDGINEDLSEIIRLVHWDGFSLKDAAKLLGIPDSTARGRYQRAKAEIRLALATSDVEERHALKRQ